MISSNYITFYYYGYGDDFDFGHRHHHWRTRRVHRLYQDVRNPVAGRI